ncbi:MAG: DUF1848 family protein [Syntrophobacteraceae bacterium]
MFPPHDQGALSNLMRMFREQASMSGMVLQSCADELDLQRFGIPPGKCVDDALISRVFGLDLKNGTRRFRHSHTSSRPT